MLKKPRRRQEAAEDTFTTWKYLSNQTIYDNQAAWE